MSSPQNPLTVAIVGATLNTLLAGGYRLRALTRNPLSEPAQTLAKCGIEVRPANLLDTDSLLCALKGVDALFGMSTPFGSSVEVEVIQGKNLIDAAVANRLKHFVFSSAANANLHTGVPHFESKYQIEQYLVASDIPWTIIAPAAFMDDFKDGWYKRSLEEGQLAMVMPADRPLYFICSEDIGAMAALAISQPERFTGKRLEIAGDKLTGAQIAALFSSKYGRTITYREVPLAAAETYSLDLAAMFRYFQQNDLGIDLPALHSTYPEVAWHSFARWISQQA